MSLLTTNNLLREFPNPVYVETGIYRGDSLQLARESGAFQRFIGIELEYEHILFCKNRFNLYASPDPSIELYHKDSAEGLFAVIENIDSSITFFLDSHWQMRAGTNPGHHPFPLFNELLQIGSHAQKFNKQHTIIIDDVLYLTHPDITGWGKADIEYRLKLINPDFKFKYLANPIVNNLLVALP